MSFQHDVESELSDALGGNETFTLPDGSTVGTGMLRLADGPRAMYAQFPQELLLDDADIKRLLSARSIADSRAKRKYRVQNQGQVGSCASYSAVGCHYQVQALAGRVTTALQPEHLYARVNGGRDAGSMLDRNYSALQLGGCSIAGSVPYESYRRSQQATAAADVDGMRFRIHEPYALPDDYVDYVRALASAIARGYPVNIAWDVTSGSMRLRNGFCVVGGGVGNHASFLHEAEWIGGRDLITADLCNSWGPVETTTYGRKARGSGRTHRSSEPGGGWGEGGFGRISMQDIFRTRRYHVHNVLTSVIDDPKAVNPL